MPFLIAPTAPPRRGPCLATIVCLMSMAAGVVHAADDALIKVVDLLDRDDFMLRAIALERIRDGVKGEAATRALVAVLGKQPESRQPDLIRALAARGDVSALPAIVGVLERAVDPAVRNAAIRAVGDLGNKDAVGLLVKSLANPQELQAARYALVAVRGDDATQAISAAAESGNAAVQNSIISILLARYAKSSLPLLLELTKGPDPAVSLAAVKALQELAGPANVPAMVAGLRDMPAGDGRKELERAIVHLCKAGVGQEQARRQFMETFQAAAPADAEKLLGILGGIGGPASLSVIDDFIASPDADRRKLGIQALARWPDATVVPRVVPLIAAARDAAERELLVTALIRLAPLPSEKLSDAERLTLLNRTMELCTTDDQRSRLLERAHAVRTVETFRFVLPYLDQPALATAACRSVVELAHDKRLRDAHTEEFRSALDKVVARTTDEELVERATLYKEGKTWLRKK